MDRLRTGRPSIRPTDLERTAEAPSKGQTAKPASRPSGGAAPTLRKGGLTGTSFVAQKGKVAGTRTQTELRAGADETEVTSAHALRLRNKAGDLVTIPAHNYILDETGAPRASLGALGELIASRPASAQAKINKALTQAHGDHEMSFRVKNPDTGNYDKIFVVPVHGTPVPITEAHFDTLIRSTEPVMQALRGMLQSIYAKKDFTAKDLGIDTLPQADQERVLRSIKESVYFEPKLVHPAMKDYPFLSVGGFDAAIGDLEKPQPIFFEFNLGTPSGLSNNVQLQEALRAHDPELFSTIAARLPKDETFSILKDTIDSCAARWTGRADGISVVLGPGVFNGAHPDVASIAMFSGMPLAEPNDLYVDKAGDVRMKSGVPGKPDPVVTGIYGRMEESYFLQDSRKGLPIRGPDFEDNLAIGQRLGVKLEPNVAYAWELNAKDEIIGVQKGPDGQPLLMPVIGGGMGADPARPDAAPGSFLDAILGKKLYYSGLGGRVVDDKRIFQAIADHVAPRHVDSPDAPIARPPRTLDPSEYQRFYDAPDLTKFVVKEPDKSGGSGVYLLVNMDPADRQRVVADVKKDPGLYIVQEFADIAVMVSTEKASDGRTTYGTRACDARIFPMMDADGNVRAGPNAVLLRVANTESASTNTSQGASYGIAVVLKDEAGEPAAQVLPPTATPTTVGARRMADLDTFLDALNRLTTAARAGQVEPGLANSVAHQQRLVMDLLGRSHAPLMTALRAFGEASPAQALAVLEGARAALFSTQDFPAPGVAARVHAKLAEMPKAREAAAPFVRGDLGKLLARGKLETAPAEVVRVDLVGDRTVEKLVTDRVRSTGDKQVDQRIAELERAGGELRQLALRDADTKAPLDVPASSYFALTPDGRPVIGIDLAGPKALAALDHELAHLKLWRAEREHLIRGGTPKAEAGKLALERLNAPDGRLRTERAAVTAELAAVGLKSPFNVGDAGPTKVTDEGYVSRVCYPELEALRELFHGMRHSEKPAEPAVERALFTAVLTQALDLREARFEARLSEAKKLERGGKTEAADALRARAHEELGEPLFDLIWSPGDQDRLRTDGTLRDVTAAFRRALAEHPVDALVPGDAERLRADAERRAAEAAANAGVGLQQQQ